MVIVVPKPDYRSGKIMLIAERAQAGGAQKKVPAFWTRTESQPASSQDANEMPAGEKQYVARNCAKALHHTVRPLSDLFRRFASGAAIPEQLPFGAFAKDLR